MVGVLARMFGGGGRAAARARVAALYGGVVATARDRGWYADGGVPDTIDGRFDAVTTVTALVLLRLEALGPEGTEVAARLTETFVEDMDGQLRQRGIGDLVVGKHVGRMMGQLGGRIGAYRTGLAADGDLDGAVARNLHRGAAATPAASAAAVARVRALADRLATRDLDALLAGRL